MYELFYLCDSCSFNYSIKCYWLQGNSWLGSRTNLFFQHKFVIYLIDSGLVLFDFALMNSTTINCFGINLFKHLGLCFKNSLEVEFMNKTFVDFNICKLSPQNISTINTTWSTLCVLIFNDILAIIESRSSISFSSLVFL